MNILVLMAGNGKRFTDAGYTIPKPFIPINGKPMFAVTLDSLPFIKDKQYTTLSFAVRSDHQDYTHQLYDAYGPDINLAIFESLTGGSMETAARSFKALGLDGHEPLLILDADNYYDGSQFLDNIKQYDDDFASICYFQRLDDSIKWGFAILQDNEVVDILEKDPKAIELDGKPMVGVFYFSNGYLFTDAAKHIIETNSKEKGEFYMTQAVRDLLKNGIPVHGVEVTNVIPLGTPADVSKVEKQP